jgi:hypothetical protein
VPPVTVLMPVSDAASYVGDAVRSVVTQTFDRYDVRAAVATRRRMLAPRGACLFTVPGISQTDAVAAASYPVTALRRRVTLLPLSAFDSAAARPNARPATMLVTFGDGYADSLYEVPPVPQRYRVSRLARWPAEPRASEWEH